MIKFGKNYVRASIFQEIAKVHNPTVPSIVARLEYGKGLTSVMPNQGFAASSLSR
jgi:hypothetical protein